MCMCILDTECYLFDSDVSVIMVPTNVCTTCMVIGQGTVHCPELFVCMYE